MKNIIEKIKPNVKIKLFFNENNINNKIIHIRSIVDEEYVAFRVYSKRKGWIYKIEHITWFEVHSEYLTKV